jgi:hypothetical protein
MSQLWRDFPVRRHHAPDRPAQTQAGSSMIEAVRSSTPTTVSREDQAKSMILSEWHQSPEVLQNLGEAIKAGRGLAFRSEDIDDKVEGMKGSELPERADDLLQTLDKMKP